MMAVVILMLRTHIRTMETIHLGFCMHVVYTYFVLDFSNIDYVFNKFVW